MLPAPSQFWIRKLHIIVDEAVHPDNWRGLRSYSWVLRIMQKGYDEGTLAENMTLAYPPMVQDRDLMVGTSRETRTYPETRGLHIPPQAFFIVDLTGPGLTVHPDNKPGLDIVFALEGLEARAIQ
jgi:hypothetical protein